MSWNEAAAACQLCHLPEDDKNMKRGADTGFGFLYCSGSFLRSAASCSSGRAEAKADHGGKAQGKPSTIALTDDR